MPRASGLWPRNYSSANGRKPIWFGCRKNDPGKLAIAARLRRETTLPLKAIAARVGLGTSKAANAKLHRYMSGGALNETDQGQLGI